MAETEYIDFDLLLENFGDKYKARVLNPPSGQAICEFEMPFSELQIENFYLKIGRPRRGMRKIDTVEMTAAKAIGTQLFNKVFRDEVYASFRSSLIQVRSLNQGLRIRLRIDAPELNELPWEYLYSDIARSFLSLSIDTPIIRYIDLPQPPQTLTTKPPIRILAMISSPIDYPLLDVEREWEKLQAALSDLQRKELIKVDRLEKGTLSELQRQLRRADYHVFHFIGHGGFDDSEQDGVLVLEKDNGRGQVVKSQYLGTILHNHHPLRLVVLNACEGARTSRQDPFAGTAQSLVHQGIPAVIAMQFEITDNAAITFAEEFYSAIADGYPIDSALGEARTAIFAQGNDIEWGRQFTSHVHQTEDCSHWNNPRRQIMIFLKKYKQAK